VDKRSRFGSLGTDERSGTYRTLVFFYSKPVNVMLNQGQPVKNIALSILFVSALAKATSLGLTPVDDGRGTIGDPAAFAVIDGSVNIDLQGMADIVLRFNYQTPGSDGPSSDLGSYNHGGIILSVGDLLFEVGGHKYGIPLTDHSGAPNGGDVDLFANVLKGHFYQTDSFLTTDTVLNTNDTSYRPGFDVWLGATVSDLGNFEEQVSREPGTSTYTVEFIGKMPQSFLDDVETHNALKVEFGSAVCANGYLVGELASPVPEPVSLALIGSGLVVLGCLRRRKSQ